MIRIDYNEAADILGRSVGTLKHAIGREVFTQIPSAGKVRFLSKEQVQLFIGKTQLSTRSLNRDELKKWEQYRDEIISPASISTPVESSNTSTAKLDDIATKLQLLDTIGTTDLANVSRGLQLLDYLGKFSEKENSLPFLLPDSNPDEDEQVTAKNNLALLLLSGIKAVETEEEKEAIIELTHDLLFTNNMETAVEQLVTANPKGFLVAGALILVFLGLLINGDNSGIIDIASKLKQDTATTDERPSKVAV